MTPLARGGLALVLALSAACTSATDDAAPPSISSASTATTTGDTGSVEIGPTERPAQLVAPDEVTGLAPLVVLLHGYGSNAEQHDRYLGVTEQAATRGMYVLLPNGTTSASGLQFWDSRAACCNFSGTPVDDTQYLSDLIDEAIADRPIDPERVYLFGHSNGGFMSYRMACVHAEQIAAVAVLAGSDPPVADDCEPSDPVAVLHLHGTDDEVIGYDGGTLTTTFPGAEETIARWAARDGCDEAGTVVAPVDLDAGIEGAETAVTSYEGCDDGVTVQRDTIEEGMHSPDLPHEVVGTQVLDWLLAQSR